MKSAVLLLFLILPGPLSAAPDKPTAMNLASRVNPFIGTGGHGHTHPAATCPFGMAQIGPQTRMSGWDGCSGYHYDDSDLLGFAHTHLSGTGVLDYGDLLLLPLSHLPEPDTPQPIRTPFDHARESANPGHYEVFLPQEGITVSITATPRGGIFLVQFPQDRTPCLLINLNYRDTVLRQRFGPGPEGLWEGSRISRGWAREQHLHFCFSFDTPPSGHRELQPGIYLLTFPPGTRSLEIRSALSSVDGAGASRNLKQELMDKSRDELVAGTDRAWQEALNTITIRGGSSSETRIFTTALYHSLLSPNLFSDSDGRYRGMDQNIHQAILHPQYTVFSLWDTFRATHPLLTLIRPREAASFLHTLMRHYRDGGRLPIWELSANETHCMIGQPAIPVLADGMLKGLAPDLDPREVLKAMLDSTAEDAFGLIPYRAKGFLSREDGAESVSKTLEYAFADACLARWARHLGETATAIRFEQSSLSPQHLFDPQTRFFRPRLNGGWLEPFDPREVTFDFTEANAWQYTFFMPHQVQRLIRWMGGPGAFVTHLNHLFEDTSSPTGREQADITGLTGQYAQGNEPSHHVAYLYTLAGRPDLTQERIHQLRTTWYRDTPDGLCGNEDCGQMSSWYVFSALGLYPVDPCSGRYILTTPLFPEAVLRLGSKTFTISTRRTSSPRPCIYIQSLTLNGKPLHRLWLEHQELMAGGHLEVLAAPTPPPPGLFEIPQDEPIDGVENPAPLILARSSFRDKQTISVHPLAPEQTLLVRTDGQDPQSGDTARNLSFTVSDSADIRARAQDRWGRVSPVARALIHRVTHRHQISLQHPPHPQYPAGGAEGLVDGLRGGTDFRTGLWQGHYREDMVATLHLDGSVPAGSRIGLGCLQDMRSWILMPRSVRFEGSLDGKVWFLLGEQFPSRGQGEEQAREDIGLTCPRACPYLRITAFNPGPLPEGHPGAGQPSFIFVDEILLPPTGPQPDPQ